MDRNVIYMVKNIPKGYYSQITVYLMKLVAIRMI